MKTLSYRIFSVFCAISMLFSNLMLVAPVAQAAPSEEATVASGTGGMPSGKGTVILDGPMGVMINTATGNLSYALDGFIIVSNCPGCCNRPTLDVSLGYNSQRAADTQSILGFRGWEFPYDYSYTKEVNGDITIRSGGSETRFTAEADGSFTPPAGVHDQLTEPQTDHYVLTSGDLTYYFDSPRHRRVTRIESTNGRYLVFAYDLAGKLTSITDLYGRRLLLEYDGDYLFRLTDPNVTPSRSITYHHDDEGHLTAITDPLGRTTFFSYDDAGNLVTVTNPDGSQRTYQYDPLNRPTLITEELGDSLAYAYDGADNLRSVIDAYGHAVQFAYDQLGRLTGETDPLGNTTSFAYSLRGERTAITNPDGHAASEPQAPGAPGRVHGVEDRRGLGRPAGHRRRAPERPERADRGHADVERDDGLHPPDVRHADGCRGQPGDRTLLSVWSVVKRASHVQDRLGPIHSRQPGRFQQHVFTLLVFEREVDVALEDPFELEVNQVPGRLGQHESGDVIARRGE